MSLLQIGKRKKTFPTLKRRIYLSVSSEGYGHSSRALAVARYLEKDEVLVGTYNYAYDRVRQGGYPVVPVAQEFEFVASQGLVDMSKTILHNQSSLFGLNQLIQEEVDIIKANAISLVVADGRMASVLAASRLDIPCLVMTNQSAYYPFFERESELVRLFGRSFEWVMKLWLCSAEEILIPDFLPPDTICLPNLSQNHQVKKRTRFVGPLVAWQASEIIPIPKNADRPLVVASLGGHAYRKPLFDHVLNVAATLPNIDFEVIGSFTPDSPVSPNVRLQQAVQSAAPYFKAADVVITQAGHSTAMELLTLGKPCVVVPDSNQIEQENNAERLAALGVAKLVRYEQFDHHSLGKNNHPSPLKNALLSILEDLRYREQAQHFARLALELNGAENTAQHLREYAYRLLAY